MAPRDQKLVALGTVLLLVAVGIIYWTIRSQQVEVTKVIATTPGSSPKAQWMKENNNGKIPNATAPSGTQTNDAAPGKSKPGEEGQ